MMLTYKKLTDAVSGLIKGYSPKGMQEALNNAMNELAAKFQPMFLVRKYVVNIDNGVGPYTVYTDDTFVTEADFIEPFYHPTKANVSGLVSSATGVKVIFFFEGNKIVLTEDSWEGSELDFWCIKTPSPMLLDSVDTNNALNNVLGAESDFPTYSLMAVAHMTAHYLALGKRDFERADYFLNKVDSRYGLEMKSKANGDWGSDNPGETSKNDQGEPATWA